MEVRSIIVSHSCGWQEEKDGVLTQKADELSSVLSFGPAMDSCAAERVLFLVFPSFPPHFHWAGPRRCTRPDGVRSVLASLASCRRMSDPWHTNVYVPLTYSRVCQRISFLTVHPAFSAPACALSFSIFSGGATSRRLRARRPPPGAGSFAGDLAGDELPPV